jgi:MFS family permease
MHDSRLETKQSNLSPENPAGQSAGRAESGIAAAESGDGPGVIWDREHTSLTLGLILTVSMAAFEAMAVATVLPVAVRDIGGLELYGWAFSGFMLANLIGISAAGSEADRRGAARPFLAGNALFIAGLLVAGSARSMSIVAAGRIVQGFGAGAISSVAYVAIARGYPSSAKPRMLALISSAWVVPGLIGPAIAGTVADHLGWRWVFFGLVPPMGIAASLAVPALRRLERGVAPESASVATSTRPALPALRLAAGAGAALFGLGGDSSLSVGATLVAIGLVVGVMAFQRLVPEGTLRARPGLPAAVATAGILGFIFFAAEAFLPLSFTEVRGQSATAAGIALTMGTIFWTTGAWVQAREARLGRRRWLIIAGIGLIATGTAGAAATIFPAAFGAAAPAIHPWLVNAIAAASWGLSGLGMGLAYSTTALVVLESASPGGEGEASAAMQLSNVLGTALGTGLGGACVALATAVAQPVAAGIVLVDAVTIVVAIVGLWAARGFPRDPAKASPASA